ncbi:MAG: fold metallo-hydrolase [Akkermansiaceae bacterium]|nr:fold metallo-hydrolase [Akkermansiaceae bacterium]
MAADFELTFLGTATSVGVPVIGCPCAVCRSADPRDKRTRSSIHLQYGGISLLIDSGPDLRQQALREGLTRLDAVIYTHSHVDHVVGFDELRAFCWFRNDPLPMHATQACMNTLQTMFPWAFIAVDNAYRGYIRPDPLIITGPFSYGDVTITPLPVVHASVETLGFLIEIPEKPKIAYLPDVKVIPDETLEILRGTDILIIDALRPLPHPTHLSVPEAVAIIGELEIGRAWLTHIGHDLGHAELEASLPDHIRVSYDGLKLAF